MPWAVVLSMQNIGRREVAFAQSEPEREVFQVGRAASITACEMPLNSSATGISSLLWTASRRRRCIRRRATALGQRCLRQRPACSSRLNSLVWHQFGRVALLEQFRCALSSGCTRAATRTVASSAHLHRGDLVLGAVGGPVRMVDGE